MNHAIRLVVLAFVAIGLLALPAVASAQTDERAPDDPRAAVERIKGEAAAAIELRYGTIADLTAAIEGSEAVTADHADQLLGDLADAQEGLETLEGQIAAAQTLEALRELVPQIATEFRIYLVVAPKVHGVLASDTIVSITGLMADAETTLQGHIDRAAEAGFDTTEVQAMLDDAAIHREAASAGAAPVADDVIGLQAADWPDPAAATIAAARDSLVAAHADGRAAAEGYRATAHALRDLVAGG